MAEWPGEARGALCLSFDNLGVDETSSAAKALPGLLKRLGEHDLTATFFIEGVNAELDPGALREIGAAGHEVAYHAWRHETWGELSTEEQAENLAHGVDAFAGLGLEIAGLRPPGGQLGPDGIEVLREDQLPAYNAVLWAWGISSALSLLTETKRGSRGFAIAGLLNFPILLASADHHFRWAREQAKREPERWSAALLED